MTIRKEVEAVFFKPAWDVSLLEEVVRLAERLVAEEQEACAKLAEELFPDFDDPEWYAIRLGAGQEVADAIRARKDA